MADFGSRSKQTTANLKMVTNKIQKPTESPIKYAQQQPHWHNTVAALAANPMVAIDS